MLVDNLERVVGACADAAVLSKATKVVYHTSNKETKAEAPEIDIHQDGTARPEQQNFVELIGHVQRFTKYRLRNVKVLKHILGK